MSDEPLTLDQAQQSARRIERAFGVEPRLQSFSRADRKYSMVVSFPLTDLTFSHTAGSVGGSYEAWTLDGELFDDFCLATADSWADLFDEVANALQAKADEHQEVADACLGIVEAYHEQ